jgi:predicted small lipoprotein YifL
MNLRGLKWRRLPRAQTLLLGAWLVVGLSACGQKGPLYLPDHRPEAVPAAPGTAVETPATRKAPNTPDPATAR